MEQVRRLLEACQRFDPGLLAFEALGLFVGLRREECLRLAREETGAWFVETKGRKAKTRQRPLVPVSAQLRAWLDAAGQAGATYPPLSFVGRFEALRAEARLHESPFG